MRRALSTNRVWSTPTLRRQPRHGPIGAGIFCLWWSLLRPARLGRTIESAQKNGVDFVVIDTPPHADAAAREAIKTADLVLIPTRPRAFDLAALEPIADLVNFAKTPAYVVLNAVPTGATKLAEEARKTAQDMGLEICPVELGERADFHRSSAKGETAGELDPDGKAAKEIDKLWKWLNKSLKKAAK